MDGAATQTVLIREFRPEDQEACRRLYVEGLIGGKLAENDTGLDVDDIQMAYIDPPGNSFWVAQSGTEPGVGDVVGMIGVQQHDDGVGEIRRLRVDQAFRRRGIGSRLLETAVVFCRDRGYLKIALDTFVEREPAIRLFEKFRFRHGRTREMQGKQMLVFYYDLYGSDQTRA